MSLSTLFVALVALAGFVNAQGDSDSFWVVSHPALLTTRFDPLVNPGVVSAHVHSILGTSSFLPDYDYDNSLAGQCTTANIAVDKSSYWAPQLYRKYDNGSLGLVPLSYANTYYEMRRVNDSEVVHEFPPGFRMMAGNPFRTTANDSDITNTAVNYACLNFNAPATPQTDGFPTTNCPDGLRAQVYFPHCWDGVNNWLEGSAHVSYGTDSTDAGGGSPCPGTHPVRIMGLFYEFIFEDDYDYEPGARVWSFGDDVGYGFHGDFTNGWPVGLFTDIFNAGAACNVGFSLSNCPVLAPYVATNGSACAPENFVVDENIGYTANLTALPGNNPIFGGSVVRDPSTTYVETAEVMWARPQIPDNWKSVGCIAEGTSGRALSSDSTTSPDMSPDFCISFCATAGYSLAGVEYSDECYCGNAVGNGASMTLLSPDECSNPCAGALYGQGMCGGGAKLNIYQFTGTGAVSADAVVDTPFSLSDSTYSPTQILATGQATVMNGAAPTTSATTPAAGATTSSGGMGMSSSASTSMGMPTSSSMSSTAGGGQVDLAAPSSSSSGSGTQTDDATATTTAASCGRNQKRSSRSRHRLALNE